MAVRRSIRFLASSAAAPGSRIKAIRELLKQDVRPGMELDLNSLATCLRDHLKDEERPFVRQLSERATYELRPGDPTCRPLVVRFGRRASHEFQIVSALHELSKQSGETNVSVARPLMLWEDDRPMGRPFYVTEFVEGRTFFDAAFTDAPDDVHVAGAQAPRMGSLSAKRAQVEPADRANFQNALVDMAATLHSIDVESLGLKPAEGRLGGSLDELTTIATRVFQASSDRALQDTRLASYMEQVIAILIGAASHPCAQFSLDSVSTSRVTFPRFACAVDAACALAAKLTALL